MQALRFLTGALAASLLGALATAQVSQINVEIDYMEGVLHSHRPEQSTIDAVVQMFACKGITLNVVISEAIPEVTVMRCPDPGNQSFFTCAGPESFLPMKAAFADQGLLPGWHYCIFGHKYDDGEGTSSSGLGEFGGDDFIVTLAGFNGLPEGSAFDQAATFAHELGHNLGLSHSAPGSVLANGPYAPNYASIMSYQYQLGGVRSRMECLGIVKDAHLFKDLDYSSGRLAPLVEPTLDERDGVGIASVDWDCDGAFDSASVSEDLDGQRKFCSAGSGGSFLFDSNDWANLSDNARLPQVKDNVVHTSYERCITRDEQDALQRGAGVPNDPTQCWPGTQPTLTIEPCESGKMVFVANGSGTGLGTGTNPYRTLNLGLAGAPNGSVLFLQNGTYAYGGADIVISRPLTLTGPRTAVIAP